MGFPAEVGNLTVSFSWPSANSITLDGYYPPSRLVSNFILYGILLLLLLLIVIVIIISSSSNIVVIVITVLLLLLGVLPSSPAPCPSITSTITLLSKLLRSSLHLTCHS